MVFPKGHIPEKEIPENFFCCRRTNNVSEARHIRFAVVEQHLDLYTALREFRKEQADTESIGGRAAQHRKESQSSTEAEMGDHAGAHSISCRELLRLQGQGRYICVP